MRLTVLTATLAFGVLSGPHFAHGQTPPDAPPSPPTVMLEARWATVPAALCEKLFPDLKPGPGGTLFLADDALKELFTTLQTDRRVNVLQAPRMAVTAHRTGTVGIDDQRFFATAIKAVNVKGQTVCVPQNEAVALGTRLSLTPFVSADGKSVKLVIEAERKTLGACDLVPVVTQITPVFEGGSQGTPIPFTQYLQVPHVKEHKVHVMVNVPVGGHVLIPGPVETREVREEFGVPFLSEIPYLDRLFKNVGVGRVAERTILIVSPRAVAAEAPAVPPAATPATVLRAPVEAPTPGKLIRVGHTVPVPAPLTRERDGAAELVKAYHRACAAGDRDAAMRLAVQALALDPTCFGPAK